MDLTQTNSSLNSLPTWVLNGIASEAVQAAARQTRAIWIPQTGPQTNAAQSKADVVGYGGAAGGGKSDLLLGKAGTQHQRSIIFRRVFPSLRGLIERSKEIYGDGAFNETTHLHRLSSGTVEFGSIQYQADLKKYQGQPHDFIGIDEGTEFPEAFIRFLMGWNRSATKGQKCQTVITFNPPMDDAGSWVITFFGPWLDEKHPKPAADGELRWFAMLDGKETERPDGQTFDHKGETVNPKSRTFFHASLKDNPILAASGYGATIDSMPEPLRSILRGSFKAGMTGDPWQVIPPAWVKLAQARWTEKEQTDPPEAVGVDPARGGGDVMAIARVWGNWFAPLETHPGESVPDGPSGAALLMDETLKGVSIGVDVIGIGSSVYDSLMANGARVTPINFAEKALNFVDHTGKLKFRNIRAAAYWALRDALDPEHGMDLAIPPSTQLLGDLCAPRFKMTTAGIQLESKDDIKERIGRSPDEGDALVMAWWVIIYSRVQFW